MTIDNVMLSFLAKYALSPVAISANFDEISLKGREN